MKLCVKCDSEFSTPGIRCEKCRANAVPTLKTINERQWKAKEESKLANAAVSAIVVAEA
jgi:DNA-directed RNA polymerase subunit RPC12/RpoP